MGATFVVKLPDIGEGVVEAELVGWHVQVGDIVREDQVLAEVMTDKATVEIPAPCSGTVTALAGEVGTKLVVGAELLRLEAPGAAEPQHPPAEPAAPAEAEAPPPLPEPPRTKAALPARKLASPAVRQRARALGLDLGQFQGSGPEGRILHADLDAVLRGGAGAVPARVEQDGTEEISVIGLRRRIAERMRRRRVGSRISPMWRKWS